MEDATRKKQNRTVRRIVTIAVAFLLLALGGLFVWQTFFATPSDGVQLENAVKAQLGQLENKTNDEIAAELNRVIEEGSMAISINLAPVFVDGQSEGTLQIENSPANKYAQEVVITMDETGEEIYRSGLLMPNYHIQTDKLATVLAAGDYNCTATFVGYDLDIATDITEIGTAAAKIRITVIS